MTCSKSFGRSLQVACLGLIGMLTVVGCGGSESKNDAAPLPSEAGVLPPPKPQLNATPGTVNVGSVDVGTVSSALPVSITNTGGVAAPLTVTAAPAGLIAATGCGASLPAGQSCVLQVTGSPTAVGAFQGSVTVAAAGGNTVVIVVQGVGVAPGNFTVAPTAIDLGSLAVGEVVQTTVTVTANANLTGLSTTVRGTDLRIEATSTCVATLSANQSCTVAVRFTAGAAGASSGNAVVVSQGGVTKTVPITANVLTPAKLAATPATAGLTARVGETSLPQTINIGNIGGMASGQLAVAIAPASFKVVSETCSIVTLAAGATCSVVVTYSPTATATAAEVGTLTVTDRGVGASVATVALTGTPIIGALTLTGGPALGSVAPGAIGAEVLFTVTNTGATPSGPLTATVGSASITISSNTCATKATLATSETCTIGLRLTPAAGAAPAQVAALLTVTGANASVSLTVTGAIVTGGFLVANPTSVNFGSVFVNQLSAVKTVTITNGGATATGALSVNLTGLGAAQVALAGNTCTAALAPAQSCTLTVQYAPTDTTGVNGTIAVTDGVVSASIPMVGTGLAATTFMACKPTTSGTDPNCGYLSALAADLDMDKQTVGYTTGNAEGATTETRYTLKVMVAATATGDSGAITAALSGTNAADFAVTNNKCTAALNPGASCTMDVTFKPSAVGNRTASLTITGAKGGIWTVALKGEGLALVSLEPVPTPTPPDTGLDFGQAPNGVAGKALHYKVTVRGATSAAATSTVANVVLTTGTTPDFRNVLADGSPTEVNRCDAATLGLTANTGAATGAAPAGWTISSGYWTCDFWIQFYPQTGKSETPKTATVDATATAGGSATLTLSGTSTGPLVFDPDKYTFQSLLPGQASEASTIFDLTLTVNGDPDGGVGGQTAEFTLVNRGPAGVNQGPITLALDNTADFGIVSDGCTTLAAPLTPTAQTAGPYPVPSSCVVKVIFVQPSTATPGTKTATLTATAASGETAKATITGIVGQALNIDVNPKGTAATPVDLKTAPQDNAGEWVTFTISNPAGAARSGKLSYTVATDGVPAPDGDFELYTLATAGVTAYPTGFCGDSFTKQLAPGESCIIQVRLAPKNTRGVGLKDGTLMVSNGTATLPVIVLQGTATSQLTAAPVDVAFGQVAEGTAKPMSTTITNNGKNPLTFTIPNINTDPSVPVSIADTSVCTATTTLPAAGTCRLDYQWQAAAADIADPVDPTKPLVVTVEGPGDPATVTLDLNLSGQSVNPAALALYGFGDYAEGDMTPDPNDPAVGDEANPLVLGDQLTGSSSSPFSIWFTNTGDVDATGVVAELTGTNAAEFKIATELTTLPLCATTLKAKAKCVVPVRLAPTSSGRGKKADLTVKAGGLASVTVHLYGSGHGQSDATPGVYAEVVGGAGSTVATTGPTAVGASSKVYFTLRNVSGGSLSFGQLAVNSSSDGFAPASSLLAEATGGGTPCPATIANTASCQFSVTFAPTVFGNNSTDEQRYRWAFVRYGVDATDHPTAIASVLGQVQKPAKLQLSATSTTGVIVTLSGAASAADFGQVLQQRNGTLAFTIINVGEAATAGAVAPTITGGTDYASVPGATNGCASMEVLTANGTATDRCQFTVSVGGSTVGLRQTASLQATGTVVDENSDEVFLLKERLVQPAVIGTAADITDLGSERAGAIGNRATITVQNGVAGDSHDNRQDTGVLTVTIGGTGASSFTVNRDLSTCYDTSKATWLSLPTDVAGLDETCTVVVDFTPQSAGAKAATVTIGSTVGGTPEPISLSGIGLADLIIDPAGTTTARYAMVSSVQTFVVTNRGPEATGMLRATSQGANFVIIYDSCFGQSLGSNLSCTVDLAFTGTSSTTTAANATLTVTDGTANNTVASYVKVGGP